MRADANKVELLCHHGRHGDVSTPDRSLPSGGNTRALSLDKPAGQGENQDMAAVEKQFEGFVTSDPEILGGEPGPGRYKIAAGDGA